MSSPTANPFWQALQTHSEQFSREGFRLHDLFVADPHRFATHSLRQGDLLLDYSRNYLAEQTLPLLLELAATQGLPDAIAAMFAGDKINTSEDRPALHVALREPEAGHRFTTVSDTLARMATLVDKVHQGEWTGFTGKAVTDIVNLGVGGSDLGPALAVSALAKSGPNNCAVHFVSNIDPGQLAGTLATLNPETTLFIVASKSFTTLETRHNAEASKRWVVAKAGSDTAIARHFIAVTTNTDAAVAFGIAPDNLFPVWDWVGGRFSVWSAIGLPIALAIGMDGFRDLLAGAHSMDQHFQSTELSSNMPVVLAVLSVWYRGFFNSHSHAVVPYCDALRLLPAYLQQLCMESLGKSVDHGGQLVAMHTGEPLWGTVGTDIQHSCFQLLHQGTEFIPVDLIALARPTSGADVEAHRHLLANCFSQGLALMQGHADMAQPSRAISGNRPSNTLLVKELNPHNLGALLALYEHKVYVQSVIWDINAFDQWGVELGKQLSRDVYAALARADGGEALDASTANLIAAVKDWNR